MNKGYRTAIIAITSLSVLAGGGYGAWYAWDNGVIGDNPRALTPQAMEEATKKQARYIAVTSGASAPCLNVDLTHPQPEMRGIPGISLHPVPGQHSISLLVQTNVRDQPGREIQFAQMDYLAKQGFFIPSETTINTDDGASRAAKSYRLAWAGFANSHYSFGASICLPYGRREFAGIIKFEKLHERVIDLDVYEVEYQTKVAEIPAWALSAEAKTLFPKLAEFIEDRVGKAKIVRTKEGWRSAAEIETELGMASKGAAAGAYFKEMQKRIDLSPVIALEEAKGLMAKAIGDSASAPRIGVACVPFQLQRGGDEKEVARPDAAELLITYFDRADRKEFEYRAMANALHILNALEGAGLAEMEILRPAPPSSAVKPARRVAPKPAEDPKPVGIRYRIRNEAITSLSISGHGSGCIPAGRFKAEALAVRSGIGNFSAQLLVRATVEQTPEWSLKIAEGLPTLKAVMEQGLSMNGSLIRAMEGPDAGKWKLGGMSPAYPNMSATDIPAHLVPLMPLTAAALSNKPVKAPILEQEATTNTGHSRIASQVANTTTPPADFAMLDCAESWETEASVRDDQRRIIATDRARGVDTSFFEKVSAGRAQNIKALFMPKCERFGFVWPTDKAGETKNGKLAEKLHEKVEAIRKAREAGARTEAAKSEAANRVSQ